MTSEQIATEVVSMALSYFTPLSYSFVHFLLCISIFSTVGVALEFNGSYLKMIRLSELLHLWAVKEIVL